jgi:hypothetical protein
MIAAGVNAKALSEFMGHSGIQITFDRYGHLMPGSRDEAVERADAFLSASQLRHSEGIAISSFSVLLRKLPTTDAGSEVPANRLQLRSAPDRN